MIGWHCGQRLRTIMENRERFTKKCQVCGRTFTQRKRVKKTRARGR